MSVKSNFQGQRCGFESWLCYGQELRQATHSVGLLSSRGRWHNATRRLRELVVTVIITELAQSRGGRFAEKTPSDFAHLPVVGSSSQQGLNRPASHLT